MNSVQGKWLKEGFWGSTVGEKFSECRIFSACTVQLYGLYFWSVQLLFNSYLLMIWHHAQFYDQQIFIHWWIESHKSPWLEDHYTWKPAWPLFPEYFRSRLLANCLAIFAAGNHQVMFALRNFHPSCDMPTPTFMRIIHPTVEFIVSVWIVCTWSARW